MIIFISQDGVRPSGVTTYGCSLLRHVPESRMLLLNASDIPPAADADLRARIRCIPEAESHSPAAVVRHLDRMAGESSGPLTVLPNTGDTPWSAVALWLLEADARMRSSVRVLGIVHSDMETQYALAERFLPIAPNWIGVSTRCAEELRRRVGAKGCGIYELPYPIEVAEDRCGSDDDGPLMLAYVGRLEETQKRVSRLATLWSELDHRGIDFLMTIAGDGPARTELERLLSGMQPRIQSRIRFVGGIERSAVRELWRRHAVCLLVSAYEGMPLALLEAMAAGACPVAMSVASGLPELLRDGINARVVPQGDVPSMADAIESLARDRTELIRLGKAARNTVLERHSPDAHFRRFGACIKELHAQQDPKPEALAPDPAMVAVASLVRRLVGRPGPIAVYGAGMFGRKVVDACADAGVAVCALVDSDPQRLGFAYNGLTCRDPGELVRCGAMVVVVGSMQFVDAIRARVISVFAERHAKTPEIVTAQP